MASMKKYAITVNMPLKKSARYINIYYTYFEHKTQAEPTFPLNILPMRTQ